MTDQYWINGDEEVTFKIQQGHDNTSFGFACFRGHGKCECTNPDCKKLTTWQEVYGWIFLRHTIPGTTTQFDLVLCDECFKKMRKEF